MKKVYSILLVVVMAITLICCSGNIDDNESSGKVKIGYLSITHALPTYVMEDVEKANVELIKFNSWPDLMDALNSGKIDGASVLIELAMKAKSQGSDIKAVALGHRDGNVVIVDKDIKSAKDLIGKTIAVPSKLSTHYVLINELLKSEGVDISEVNIVELSPPEMPVALQEGRVSAYCVAEPFGAKAVVADVGKVYKESSNIVSNSICCGLVLREEFINNNSNEAEELVKKYVNAAKYIEDKGGKESAKKFLNVDDETIDLSLKWISFDKLEIEEDDYNKLVEEVKELGLINNPPTYEEFIDNSLVDKVNNNEK